MPLMKVRARNTAGSDKVVESLVEKARSQAGAERILVVYEENAACVYFEAARAPVVPLRRNP